MSECKFRAADGECLRDKMFPYKEYCVDAPCSYYTEQTNADRIRAMTDEELAEFIGGDPMHDICPSDCFEDPDRPCKVCVLKWLKQEGE